MAEEQAEKALVAYETARFDLAQTDAVGALEHAEKLIRYMADKCKGPKFVSQISGRNYPKVEWWTTVGAGLGLFPQEVSSVKLDREGELAYEGIVEVRRGDQIISRASAICSTKESRWQGRDEYAIKSMATTRATGKAYRIAFSFLAVLAGLEPTPAEEMPEDEPAPRNVGPRPQPAASNAATALCPNCKKGAPVMLSKFPEKGKWYCRDCKISFNTPGKPAIAPDKSTIPPDGPFVDDEPGRDEAEVDAASRGQREIW